MDRGSSEGLPGPWTGGGSDPGPADRYHHSVPDEHGTARQQRSGTRGFVVSNREQYVGSYERGRRPVEDRDSNWFDGEWEVKLQLIGALLNLMYPPQASKNDRVLVELIDRNTTATKDVVERASNIDRAFSNINDAGEGLFN
jgi:hypothetical protein